MDRSDLPGPIEDILNNTEGSLDSITTQLLLGESYETLYGIMDHNDPNVYKDRPLAAVAFHDKEDYTTHSRLYNTIRRFYRQKMGDFTRMNIVQFLNLPREMVEFLFAFAAEETKKNSQGTSDLIAALERESKKD